jgi:hypothetical protein
LHAGYGKQPRDHSRIQVVSLLGLEALDLYRAQRVFVDTAVHVHRLQATCDEKTGVTENGARQRDLHRDNNGRDPVLAQRGEYGLDLRAAHIKGP